MCWGPYVAINLWSVNVMRPNSSGMTVPYLADLFTTLLAFSNSALNPFIFIFLTRDFRLAVRLLLCRCLRRCPLTAGCGAAQRLRRGSRANSVVVESIRLQSRGSCDSGVEMDNQSPLRKSPILARLQCTYDNSGYDEGGGGDCGHSQSLTQSKPSQARHRYLGEDLPPNGAVEMAVFGCDAGAGRDRDSPEEQISIAVPLIPGHIGH